MTVRRPKGLPMKHTGHMAGISPSFESVQGSPPHTLSKLVHIALRTLRWSTFHEVGDAEIFSVFSIPHHALTGPPPNRGWGDIFPITPSQIYGMGSVQECTSFLFSAWGVGCQLSFTIPPVWWEITQVMLHPVCPSRICSEKKPSAGKGSSGDSNLGQLDQRQVPYKLCHRAGPYQQTDGQKE